ncbi:AraC family transcriptional regulator [Oceanicoccus sp. KOV_DT_Chl]|uniref:AraC family transcriptional regulator n=1 Tax=Oceanicoccus sp. KOV_DT_Chl TaxID=1904639 RepID=UPI000C7A4C5A|nr:AraC family transcriptional regulator [Oceanicoccus sp. KOV_DT_Chl]
MKYSHARFSLHDEVLSILYVTMLQTVLKEEGYCLRGFNGSTQKLFNHRKRISPAEYLAILEQSLQPTAATGLGFQYGKLLNLAGAGTVGQLLMSCNNIEQAIEHFMEFFPLLSLSMQFNLSWNGDICTIEVDRICKQEVSKPTQWLLTESLFYCWLHQTRFMTGKPLRYHRASFKYAKPPHWKMYESMFGCEVEFDAPSNSISIDREFFKSKITTANEPVRNIKERHCREVLVHWQSRFSICEQINTTLAKTLPDIPSLEAMAQQLNLSKSSLYRKLRDNGNNYQTIVDKFRRSQAIMYLSDTELTICEIAEQLGFSDASNFRRAFKKWTGYKPSELREGSVALPVSANLVTDSAEFARLKPAK